MNIPPIVKRVGAGIVFLGLTVTIVQAQWSIGAPGTREAPPGKNRYAMLVFANPVPGLENDFNDWYTTTHMGDLVQLEGWTGAQRFRVVSAVNPRPTKEGYRHGYVIIWDQEETDAAIASKRMTDAIAGGKSRRGAGFDYIGGMGAGGTYQVMGPRIKRSDGKGPFLPDASDNKTPRPNRYVVMDFANPAPGKDAEFETATNQRIKDVLALPGWMAAQRFRLPPAPAGRGGRPTKPAYLTIWELEGRSAQSAQETLTEATKSAKVKSLSIDESTAEFVYWEPLTPYITKEDFIR